MKELDLLRFFAEFSSLSLEERLKSCLPTSFLLMLENSPKIHAFLNQQPPGLQRKKLPLASSPDEAQISKDLGRGFMVRTRTLFLSRTTGREVISLWAWNTAFRQLVEMAVGEPIRWFQWDWNEGWDKWKRLDDSTTINLSHQPQTLSQTPSTTSVIVLDHQPEDEHFELTQITMARSKGKATEADVNTAAPSHAQTSSPQTPHASNNPEASTAPQIAKSKVSPRFFDQPKQEPQRSYQQNAPVIALGGPSSTNQPPPTPSAVPSAPPPSPPKSMLQTPPPPSAAPVLPKTPAGPLPLLSRSHTEILKGMAQEQDMSRFLKQLNDYLNCSFSSGIVFLVQGTLVAAWNGFGIFSDMKKLESYQLTVEGPSLFKIVLDSMQPFHGFVVNNPIHQAFCAHFGISTPEHLTLVPVMSQGEMVLLIGGACTQAQSQSIDLYQLYDEAQEIGKVFIRLSQKLAVA